MIQNRASRRLRTRKEGEHCEWARKGKNRFPIGEALPYPSPSRKRALGLRVEIRNDVSTSHCRKNFGATGSSIDRSRVKATPRFTFKLGATALIRAFVTRRFAFVAEMGFRSAADLLNRPRFIQIRKPGARTVSRSPTETQLSGNSANSSEARTRFYCVADAGDEVCSRRPRAKSRCRLDAG